MDPALNALFAFLFHGFPGLGGQEGLLLKRVHIANELDSMHIPIIVKAVKYRVSHKNFLSKIDHFTASCRLREGVES
ncbi:hypothetical protein [Paractinoplanes lichenicola]|uniref:hypothetical protein n=1 Tax=Paractinoplanes lichenicola TaxID=2802976 RepID=UPI001F26629A|nr:hypothetical protein [Actinoplanes lichenicola]